MTHTDFKCDFDAARRAISVQKGVAVPQKAKTPKKWATFKKGTFSTENQEIPLKKKYCRKTPFLGDFDVFLTDL